MNCWSKSHSYSEFENSNDDIPDFDINLGDYQNVYGQKTKNQKTAANSI